jgi:glucose-1-phosphate adenylyltransferase
MEDRPVYTRARLLPGSKIQGATVTRSLISEGCLIENATIEQSLIGIRSVVGKDCVIRNTYVMGADDYETDKDRAHNVEAGLPNVGIGDGTVIENAIIDKNARVGAGVRLQNLENHLSFEDGTVIIREGLTVVPRGGVVPNGYRI